MISDSIVTVERTILFDIAQRLGYSWLQYDSPDPSPSPPSSRGERVGGDAKRLKFSAIIEIETRRKYRRAFCLRQREGAHGH